MLIFLCVPMYQCKGVKRCQQPFVHKVNTMEHKVRQTDKRTRKKTRKSSEDTWEEKNNRKKTIFRLIASIVIYRKTNMKKPFPKRILAEQKKFQRKSARNLHWNNQRISIRIVDVTNVSKSFFSWNKRTHTLARARPHTQPCASKWDIHQQMVYYIRLIRRDWKSSRAGTNKLCTTNFGACKIEISCSIQNCLSVIRPCFASTDKPLLGSKQQQKARLRWQKSK